MEFRLRYQGPLKASGQDKKANKEHKHEVRQNFHPQLRELWNQVPLKYYQMRRPPESTFRYIPPKYMRQPHQVGQFRFVPLVTEDEALVAQLDILLLRPEPPGSLIAKGGDIDNRLKTLFDALKMPKDIPELPPAATPETGEDPFYCLLEDDALITAVSVESDRLLGGAQDTQWVDLFIRVRIRGTMLTGNNIALIG